MSDSSKPGGYDVPLSESELLDRLGLNSGSLIKLDANENPYGASPLAVRASAQAPISRYPDADGNALRAELSLYTGCPLEQIVLGNGSDELIELACRVVLRPGDGVITCPPTFSVYEMAARACGGDVVEVRRDEVSLRADYEALRNAIKGNTRLVFLCSPNNPTGDVIGEAELRSILECGVMVVLDEAYTEFSGASYLDLTRDYENLIVLRTFSKAFGLAGLRIGYGIFPSEVAARVSNAKLPYNVNGAAQAAALAALQDAGWMREHVALILAERERLFAETGLIDGLQPLPSEANFILVRTTALPASELYDALLHRGIMVRFFQQPDLSDYLRITVGTLEQNTTLLEALRSIVDGRRQ